MAGKITFIHGTMNSGKTLDLVKTVHNYEENGRKVLVYKPIQDARHLFIQDDESKCIIQSRVEQMKVEAHWWYSTFESLNELEFALGDSSVEAVFFDECHFLSREDYYNLQRICYNHDIPFYFYGLKNNFKGELFDSISVLLSIADETRELKSICKFCGKPAKQNLRLKDKKPVFEGMIIQVGGNESYTAVCNHCYWKLKNEENSKNERRSTDDGV